MENARYYLSGNVSFNGRAYQRQPDSRYFEMFVCGNRRTVQRIYVVDDFGFLVEVKR